MKQAVTKRSQGLALAMGLSLAFDGNADEGNLLMSVVLAACLT